MNVAVAGSASGAQGTPATHGRRWGWLCQGQLAPRVKVTWTHPERSPPVSAVSRKTDDSSLCGLSNAGYGVLLKGHQEREGLVQQVPRNDLRRHLADAPGLVGEGRYDRLGGGVIPKPQQAAQCPNAQPIIGARFASVDGPQCGRSTQADDEVALDFPLCEQVKACADDRFSSVASGKGLDAASRTCPRDARHTSPSQSAAQ